jgi:hypothetical protein
MSSLYHNAFSLSNPAGTALSATMEVLSPPWRQYEMCRWRIAEGQLKSEELKMYFMKRSGKSLEAKG